MREGIYREIIEDIEMAYLKIKANKINGIYEEVEILDTNKEYEIFLKSYNIDIKDLICGENNKKYFNHILNKSILNKKYSTKSYIKKYGLYINTSIYYGENDEFYLTIFELKENNIQISSVTRQSPYLAWIKDKDGKYMDVSDKFLEIVNKSYYDVIGKTDEYVWTETQSMLNQMQDQLVLENNQKYCFEEKIHLPENTYAYFHTIKWPYKDRYNSTIGVIGISLEITDKIELRKNIEKNENFFQEISNNIEDIIMIRDEKKVLYVSNSFEKVFGFNPENLYEDINFWHDEWENISIIDGTLDYKCRKLVEKTERIRNKKFDKWIQSKFAPVFDEKGNIIKKIGIISDITKTKEIEERLESLRIDFFANLSHEIRTPITLILSCIQILNIKIANMEEKDKKYLNKYISIIKQNSYRLLKLVNNLIDTTKINSGNFDYNPRNADIISFIENICMSVSEFVKMNDMDIIFDTDEEEKIIAFDLDNMERIILNLLSNAIKYSNNNGIIKVTIKCRDDIKISVKDNGIGIPKDKQNRVFERFGQVKNKMKTESEGSGIGLFLVKHLVELNGGKIDLNSELGKGSEFIITLPNKTVKQEEGELILNKVENKIDRMNIEFSDIYI